MKTKHRTRRYKTCRCPKRQSPIVDTAHTPLMRWGLTIVALLAFAGGLGTTCVVLGFLAALAWRHR